MSYFHLGQDQHCRSDLVGEHKYGDAGQLVIAFLFFAVWVLDTYFLNYTTFLNQIIPNSIRLPLAILFFSVSFLLAFVGMSMVFGKIRKKPTVIRESVFRVVRHPIYLGEMLLYLGFIVLSMSISAFFVLGIAFIFLNHIAKYEEKQCLEYFGEEYQRYMRQVPRWIPRFGRKRKET
ncbi:MAG: isoprenylcysteine carboxylmethyltransferase family protein [Calditrichaeota bacterium]|nr:MAG: isoprenylcysteine carboxylmethyltransferase family protein [Calditrichota bacterium]